MNDYQISWAAFANYFEALAQVSGALVGLVFVALTYNDRLLGNDGHPGLRALAQQIFTDYLTVLVLSLIALVPHFSMLAVGGFLIAAALIGIGRIVRAVTSLLRVGTGDRDRRMLLQRFGLSLMGNMFFLIGGGLLLRAKPDSTFWSLLVSGTIALLISGSRSAWLLVTHARRED